MNCRNGYRIPNNYFSILNVVLFLCFLHPYIPVIFERKYLFLVIILHRIEPQISWLYPLLNMWMMGQKMSHYVIVMDTCNFYIETNLHDNILIYIIQFFIWQCTHSCMGHTSCIQGEEADPSCFASHYYTHYVSSYSVDSSFYWVYFTVYSIGTVLLHLIFWWYWILHAWTIIINRA